MLTANLDQCSGARCWDLGNSIPEKPLNVKPYRFEIQREEKIQKSTKIQKRLTETRIINFPINADKQLGNRP